MTKFFEYCFFKTQIKHATAKAYLVTMPKASYYHGMAFWVPQSLCRPHGKKVMMVFPETMTFRLQSENKGRTAEIEANEMAEELGVYYETLEEIEGKERP